MTNISQKNRYQTRLEDFSKALDRLKESLRKKKLTELEQDGVIQRFEFTFELAWKTIKDYLEDQGFKEIASPKRCIKKAYSIELIKNGNAWIMMLDDRNRLSHLNNKEISLSIFNNIKNVYLNELKKLGNKLKNL